MWDLCSFAMTFARTVSCPFLEGLEVLVFATSQIATETLECDREDANFVDGEADTEAAGCDSKGYE